MRALIVKSCQIIGFLVISGNAASATTNLLTLSCKVSDPLTPNISKSSFAPGEQALLSLSVEAPNSGNDIPLLPLSHGKDRSVHVQLAVTAKIVGIKLPFNIKESYSFPLSNVISEQVPHLSMDNARIITIPSGVPKGSVLNVTVNAIVGEVGSGSCKKSLSIH